MSRELQYTQFMILVLLADHLIGRDFNWKDGALVVGGSLVCIAVDHIARGRNWFRD
jgi:hypothetical protein